MLCIARTATFLFLEDQCEQQIQNIRILADNWGGSKQVNLQTRYMDNPLQPITFGDFMEDYMNLWDVNKVQGMFQPNDATVILSCPILPGRENILVWGHLSSGVELTLFGLQFEETVVQALRDCITIQTILQQFGIHGRVRLDYSQDCLSWVTSAHSILEVTCMFMVNRFPQHGYWLLSMNTRHLQKEYLADQSLHSPVQQSTLLAHKWRPPTADTVKVNFDKAFDPNIGAADASIVEAFPCYEAILLSSDKGWRRVLIEDDAANVINYLQASPDDTSMLAQTLSEAKIMLQQHPHIALAFCQRGVNDAANMFHSYGLGSLTMLGSLSWCYVANLGGLIRELVVGAQDLASGLLSGYEVAM
ncbi:hypothetical protein V6N11_055329 [Hibiscus sabdariffa]|uniref:RNase H type-1 domain-containing protein n=1 Tax=Hibiscus sabdariffa TaxID=183260 RepID=A0ABR2PF40_9ROSI